MKKIIALLSAVVICLTLFGCGKKEGDLGKQTSVDKENGYTLVQEVLPFKYSHDEDTFKDNPKAALSGFKVTQEKPDSKVRTKTDAMNIAKKEVSGEYNKINVFFDRTRGIWKVVFSCDTVNKDDSGKETITNKGVESVYVDEDGYTLATVKA